MAAENAARRRPAPDECADYYMPYVRAAEGPVLVTMAAEREDWRQLLAGVPPGGERYRYEPGKWSLREVVGHVIDAERMFAARALAFARRDPAHYPSFDQNKYASASGAHDRPLAALAEELASVRLSTVLLFESFAAEVWDRRGTASGCEFTVRSLAWIIAGHSRHHRGVVEERYLAARGEPGGARGAAGHRAGERL